MNVAFQSVADQVTQTLLEMSDTILHHNPPAEVARKGVFTHVSDINLADELKSFLRVSFPDGLFRHQYEAIDKIIAGINTVTATRTSSGKSLIYSLPALDALCRDDDATALFLYPQKALANDQLLKLNEAVSQIPCLLRRTEDMPRLISRYDGATRPEDRPEIREDVRLLLTNPDMLHYSMLQYHDRHWCRFFANLKYIVVDECHEYRGIFGTNVAYLFRRLRQICQFHGSTPTWIATSATVNAPQPHMEKLTGVDFEVVGPERDGSHQGSRKYWMASSNEHYYEFGRKLSLKLADQGLSVLAFCPGRVAAERMMAKVQAANDSENPLVRVYRAGLSAMERETIERGLRDKSVRLVFSTSALELGIDIGEIDVVVCIGLPSSMMSLWQQAGRAARAGKEGGIVLIPAESPIDSYYANHPEKLFDKNNESLVLNLNNRHVACQHYACATSELGGDEDQLQVDILGDTALEIREQRSKGHLDLDVFYRSDPHMAMNIRSVGEGNYTLEYNGQVIGDIDEFHLLRETYRNAIYRHGGQGFRVKDVIRGRRRVLLEREYSWNDTTPFIRKKIRLKRREQVADYGDMLVATVAIDVTEFLLNVVEKDKSGNVVKQWQGNAGMPTHPLPTEGTLILFRAPVWRRVIKRLGTQEAKAAIQSCERLLWSLFPTISAPCDKQDFSSATEVMSDEQAAVYLYDTVYDGVDLTTAAFSRIGDLIKQAAERLSSCHCESDEGCFRCIANPRYPEPSSKRNTAMLLKEMQQIICDSKPIETRSHDEFAALAEVREVECRACNERLKHGARFCSNCGEKQEVA